MCDVASGGSTQCLASCNHRLCTVLGALNADVSLANSASRHQKRPVSWIQARHPLNRFEHLYSSLDIYGPGQISLIQSRCHSSRLDISNPGRMSLIKAQGF